MPKRESSQSSSAREMPGAGALEQAAAEQRRPLSAHERNELLVEKVTLEDALKELNDDIKNSVATVNKMRGELEALQQGGFFSRGALLKLTGGHSSKVAELEATIGNALATKKGWEKAADQKKHALREVMDKLNEKAGPADVTQKISKEQTEKVPMKSAARMAAEFAVAPLRIELDKEEERAATAGKGHKEVNEELGYMAHERIGNLPPAYMEKASEAINMMGLGLEESSFANLPHDAVLQMSEDEAAAWVAKAEAALKDPATVKQLKRTKNFDYKKLQSALNEYHRNAPEMPEVMVKETKAAAPERKSRPKSVEFQSVQRGMNRQELDVVLNKVRAAEQELDPDLQKKMLRSLLIELHPDKAEGNPALHAQYEAITKKLTQVRSEANPVKLVGLFGNLETEIERLKTKQPPEIKDMSEFVVSEAEPEREMPDSTPRSAYTGTHISRSRAVPNVGFSAGGFQGQQRVGRLEWQGAITSHETPTMEPVQVIERYDTFGIQADALAERIKDAMSGGATEEEMQDLTARMQRMDDLWDNQIDLSKRYGGDLGDRGHLGAGQYAVQNEAAEMRVSRVRRLMGELKRQHELELEHSGRLEKANETIKNVERLGKRLEEIKVERPGEAEQKEMLGNEVRRLLDNVQTWQRLQSASTRDRDLALKFGDQLSHEQERITKLGERLAKAKQDYPGIDIHAEDRLFERAEDVLNDVWDKHQQNPLIRDRSVQEGMAGRAHLRRGAEEVSMGSVATPNVPGRRGILTSREVSRSEAPVVSMEKLMESVSGKTRQLIDQLTKLERGSVRDMLDQDFGSIRAKAYEIQHDLDNLNVGHTLGGQKVFADQVSALNKAQQMLNRAERRRDDAMEARELGVAEGEYKNLIMELSNSFSTTREFQVALGDKTYRDSWMAADASRRGVLKAQFDRLDELAKVLKITFPKLEFEKPSNFNFENPEWKGLEELDHNPRAAKEKKAVEKKTDLEVMKAINELLASDKKKEKTGIELNKAVSDLRLSTLATSIEKVETLDPRNERAQFELDSLKKLAGKDEYRQLLSLDDRTELDQLITTKQEEINKAKKEAAAATQRAEADLKTMLSLDLRSADDRIEYTRILNSKDTYNKDIPLELRSKIEDAINAVHLKAEGHEGPELTYGEEEVEAPKAEKGTVEKAYAVLKGRVEALDTNRKDAQKQLDAIEAELSRIRKDQTGFDQLENELDVAIGAKQMEIDREAVDQNSGRFKRVWEQLGERSNVIWQRVYDRLMTLRKKKPADYETFLQAVGAKNAFTAAVNFVEILADSMAGNEKDLKLIQILTTGSLDEDVIRGKEKPLAPELKKLVRDKRDEREERQPVTLLAATTPKKNGNIKTSRGR